MGLSEAENAKQYQACMLLVERAPNAPAPSLGRKGRRRYGPAPPQAWHIGLKQYEDGALELERIAQTMPQAKADAAAFVRSGAALLAWTEADLQPRAATHQSGSEAAAEESVDLLNCFAPKIYGNSGGVLRCARRPMNAANDLRRNAPK